VLLGAGAFAWSAASKAPPDDERLALQKPSPSPGKDQPTPGRDTPPKSDLEYAGVSLVGAGKVTVTHTGKHGVQLKLGEKTMPFKEYTIEKGVLLIGNGALPPGVAAAQAEYLVDIKELRSLRLEGNGNMEATGIATKQLSLEVVGNGDITLAGSADAATVSLTGTGNVRAAKAKLKQATVRHNGFGNIEVAVSSRLDVTMTGIGTVEYTGNPVVRRSVNGVGVVRQKK
jgi:hypothetical protein